MTVEEQFIETNGITLHTMDHGGVGPTVVLAHGLSANLHFFDGIVSTGLTNHARVITLDLRGRGLSDKPDSGYTMEDHAADIVGLIASLDSGPFVMAGHSFGGLLTYHLAANHPDVVERCITLDAPFEVQPTLVEQIKPSLARLTTTVPSFEEYLAVVKQQPYFEGWWEPDIEDYYRADVEDLPDGSVKPRSQPDHIQAAVEGTLTPNWRAMVGRINQPTLVIRAREPFGPPGSPPVLDSTQAQQLMDTLAHGHLVEVEGNHITAFFGDRAATVSNAIVQFLEGR